MFGLGIRGNTLYATGLFVQSGALVLNYVGAWDTVGHAWSSLGSGVDAAAYGLTVTPSFVYVGGNFTNAGGKPSNYLGRWGAYHTVNLPLVRK